MSTINKGLILLIRKLLNMLGISDTILALMGPVCGQSIK